MTLLEPLPATVAGMTPDEDDAFRRLTAKIIRHRTRNRIRTVYYNGRNELHDLGYSLPPIAKDVEIVVGWPEKAIEGLANRVVLDGITTQDGSDLSKQVNDLLNANDLAQTAENAHTDALVHSCSFVAALQGTPDRGEPAAIIQEFPADVATGTWDSRIHGLTEALLYDVDEDETYGRQIRACYLMLPGKLIGCAMRDWQWSVYARTAWHGRLPVELLAYRPDSKRPFGRSRISRTVMSLTDSAVRTFLRSEVQAELYSVPPRYFLGVTEDMFRGKDGNLKPRWQIMLDQVLALPRDKQGNLPQVGTFTQASFEPHAAQLRQTASMFAAATSLPPDSMAALTGFITSEMVFRHAHMACGIGGGAKGFNWARKIIANIQGRFECAGGIDVDAAGIEEFERATGVRGTVLDLFDQAQYFEHHGKMPPSGWREATPDDVRRAYGPNIDVLFASMPCKGFSGLLSTKKSETSKYQALNGLTLRGIWLALEAYKDDPISVILFENVPRIRTRGRWLLNQIIALLRSYGYLVDERDHNCGELGNLAQSRERFPLTEPPS